MLVIFTDIDGVLNSSKTNPRKFPYFAEATLVTRFRTLVEETGAHVVLASTWRCDPIGLLAANHFGIPFHDLCPDAPNQSRKAEIEAWLQAHPDVERFVVIDDEDDGLGNLPLFQPSSSEGLTDQMCKRVASYLKGETDKTMRKAVLTRAIERVKGLFERSKN